MVRRDDHLPTAAARLERHLELLGHTLTARRPIVTWMMASRFRSFTHRGIVLGVLLCGLAAPQGSAAGPPRFKAVAFDYFVIFDPNSIVPEIEAAFPGRGKEFVNLWRTR